MKAVIFMGSPRLQGNTAELCKPFRARLEHLGWDVSYLTLADKQIAPCRGCYQCQQVSGTYGCVQKDDMSSMVDAILDSELIVLATPIYTWYCPAEMKALLDRFYGMNKYYGAGSGSLWAGKAIAILATHGYDAAYAATPFATGIACLAEHSKLRYLGICSLRDEEDLASFQTPEAISAAREFAETLHRTLTA